MYWIGGGSGAGKSAVARRLAGANGLRLYSTDDAMADHARRSTAKDSPLLHSFMAMDMDERWVTRSPAAMLETFHWFQGEGFDLIVEDLLTLPRHQLVVVEGFRLLPRLVQPLLASPDNAVWLLPTPGFRQAAIEKRGGSGTGFLAKTSDPASALSNLLERDGMFTDVLRAEAARLRVNVIEVDTTMDEEYLAGRVAAAFGW